MTASASGRPRAWMKLWKCVPETLFFQERQVITLWLEEEEEEDSHTRSV